MELVILFAHHIVKLHCNSTISIDLSHIAEPRQVLRWTLSSKPLAGGRKILRGQLPSKSSAPKVGIGHGAGKPMLSLEAVSGVKVERVIGVYCGSRSYRFDNIQVWPVKDFIKALFGGDMF